MSPQPLGTSTHPPDSERPGTTWRQSALPGRFCQPEPSQDDNPADEMTKSQPRSPVQQWTEALNTAGERNTMSDTLKKPAQKFTQTDRTGWILKMTTKKIAQIIPRREEPKQLSPFTDVNRPITSRHLESIERFLTDTSDWAMPSIILAGPRSGQRDPEHHQGQPGSKSVSARE